MNKPAFRHQQPIKIHASRRQTKMRLCPFIIKTPKHDAIRIHRLLHVTITSWAVIQRGTMSTQSSTFLTGDCDCDAFAAAAAAASLVLTFLRAARLNNCIARR